MKIITEVDPDFLASLDTNKNIIMCVHPAEKELLVEQELVSDTFGICLPRDLNLSQENIQIMSGVLSTTFRPNIKISHPAGLKIQFSEFVKDPKQDIFWKIYKSFDLYTAVDNDEKSSHHFVSNINFIMYVDSIRMREAGLQMVIKKGTQIVDFYFTWYVQTKCDMPQIDEIYLISDLQIYQDFMNIF